MPGKLQWRSVGLKELDHRIDREDFSTKSGIMLSNGTVSHNVESESLITEYITDIPFEFEGGDFEDDKEWFLSFDEGQKDKRMFDIVIILLIFLVLLCLCSIATPILVCYLCTKSDKK